MGKLVQFVLKMMIAGGKKAAYALDDATQRPREEQEKLLRRILQKSAKSEYGVAHHFAEIDSVDAYEENVPLGDYDSFAGDVARMVAGQENVLSSEKIVHFNVTSGTMGAPKKIPVTERHVSLFKKYHAKYLNYIAAKAVGTAWTRGKGLSLSEGTYNVLPTGVTIGSASSLHTARMQKAMPFLPFDTMDLTYTSPKEARQPSTLGVYSRYLHALFALREENITYGNVTFSSLLLELLRYIEINWKMLCDDVENGTVNAAVVMPDAERQSVTKRLSPMPRRAAQLRRIFGDHMQEPFGALIWPNLSFFICVGGDGFQPYTDKVLSRYLGKNVHILYMGLSSSEGLYSVPLQPDSPDAVFIPNGVYMEFLPVVDGERDPDGGIKHLWELETGKQYELAVTNLSGLYRYQLKDVIEVTGFYHKTPTMQFLHRAGYAINICAEKTSEAALRYAAVETCRELGLHLYDYCVCPKQDDNGSRYIFMYELTALPKGLTRERLREITEKYLIQANPDYLEELQTGNLQPTEVTILQVETFMLYRDLMIMKGRSATQLKPVHVTSNPFQERFFLGLEDTEVWDA